MEQEKIKKRNGWSWKIDDIDLKNQIENYATLKITQSYRGLSVLIMGCLLALSLLLGFFGIYAKTSDILYGLIVYIPILFFVYKGHRWAIAALMVLWTFEKGYQLIEAGGTGGFFLIIWWLAIMPYFWKALRVENERKKTMSILKNR